MMRLAPGIPGKRVVCERIPYIYNPVNGKWKTETYEINPFAKMYHKQAIFHLNLYFLVCKLLPNEIRMFLAQFAVNQN